MDTEIRNYLQLFEKSLRQSSFRQLILAKPRSKSAEYNKIVVTAIEKDDQWQLKLEKFSATQCFTEMQTVENTVSQVKSLINDHFREAYLWTDKEKWHLKISKKGKGIIISHPHSDEIQPVQNAHNRKKKVWVDNNELLKALGILNASGRINKNQGGKKRQINRFVELMSHLIRDNDAINSKDKIKVVDMGSGKGYLTFALYDYLSAQDKWTVEMTGVEQRADLVDQCNALASEMGYNGLTFVRSDIEDFNGSNIDILVALHACDTATDEAIYKGIKGKSCLIVTAPCCHKELRHAISADGTEKEILRHGILAERQSEILTDAIRALALESAGYKSKVFEFVSNQHTNKNLMVVGTNSRDQVKNEDSRQQMEQLMTKYGIEQQRLHDLLYRPKSSF